MGIVTSWPDITELMGDESLQVVDFTSTEKQADNNHEKIL